MTAILYCQSGAQKKQAQRRKIVESARNLQRRSSRLTRPETFTADEQDVSICDSESTPHDVSIRKTEYFDTTKHRSDASKNDDFPTIIVNSEIKKAIIAVGPKQPEGSFPKIRFKAVVHFQHILTIL